MERMEKMYVSSKITLRVLYVVVRVLGPGVRDADVGVKLLDAAVNVDAARGVLQLVARVV